MLGIITKIYRRFRFGGGGGNGLVGFFVVTEGFEWELCLKVGRIILMSFPSGWGHTDVSEHILCISKRHSVERRDRKP